MSAPWCLHHCLPFTGSLWTGSWPPLQQHLPLVLLSKASFRGFMTQELAFPAHLRAFALALFPPFEALLPFFVVFTLFCFPCCTAMQDLSSPTRDRTCAEAGSPNHWMAVEVPGSVFHPMGQQTAALCPLSTVLKPKKKKMIFTLLNDWKQN